MNKLPIAKIVSSNANIESQYGWYKNDTWELEKLGIIGSATESHMTINFKNIHQIWLKELAKDYIKISSISCSSAKLVQTLSSIRIFSQFLLEKYNNIKKTDINSKLIEEYLHYLNEKKLKITTRKIRLINLHSFLKLCHIRNKIQDIDLHLIYQYLPRIPKSIPRYIPETVMTQLNEHLHHLDGNLKRMILIFQETGLRISELCALEYDCLLQDSDGDYFIKAFQSKMKKEITKPITNNTAKLIQTQQNFVKNEWSNHKLLFPIPSFIRYIDGRIRKPKGIGKQWNRKTITWHLNALAQEKEIIGPTGKIWCFDTHSFRHTTATRMINSGVPQHIVQRFLGHETPTMTSIYAHIHDQTLKQEFAKYQGKIVNIAGDILKPEQLIDDVSKGSNVDQIDAKWLKKNILMQALPNGTCALPAISNACPHANACLTCTNFRTDKRHLDTHKNQLNKTIEIVKIAKASGWKRQEEMNIPIVNNLNKIISSLEDDSNDS